MPKDADLLWSRKIYLHGYIIIVYLLVENTFTPGHAYKPIKQVFAKIFDSKVKYVCLFFLIKMQEIVILLLKWESKKSEKHEKGEITSTVVPVPKNHSKPLIFRVLFRAFVKSNRATSGRSRGTIWYWLHSHIKRLKYDKNTDIKAEECLFCLFRECLAIQQAKGKCVGFLWVCYWHYYNSL